MKLIPIPAFNDNYIWMLHDERRALVVDPGDAQPVLAALARDGLTLESILVTHHHGDHTGGVEVLRQNTGAQVYGPAAERMPEPLQRLGDGDTITPLGLRFEVLLVPGHTAGHIAYWGQIPDADPVLFCGDTLFSAGCGRLFEGTPGQMLASLTRLAALPEATRVCCAHEYTLGSLRFALAVEPDNTDLQAYQARARTLRQQLLPTLPSSIGLEKAVNPFLRTHLPKVAHAVQQIDPNADDPVAVFATLRTWKDKF
ncbi:hydroxyacylglutathione hydrolase [Rhodoferax sp.]|uniref:hydroxyacylglutathione hydrolase n=1 Tax=Rhodoferax sp. TaxID=50421 RepID=UPI0025FBEB3D|nr:hydroxyacylglutathione hydrolase [Rhodoferax sp.]MCM2296989.1 hydroxyacylglutathione hydrolase [Rhodoferax sp.]